MRVRAGRRAFAERGQCIGLRQQRRKAARQPSLLAALRGHQQPQLVGCLRPEPEPDEIGQPVGVDKHERHARLALANRPQHMRALGLDASQITIRFDRDQCAKEKAGLLRIDRVDAGGKGIRSVARRCGDRHSRQRLEHERQKRENAEQAVGEV